MSLRYEDLIASQQAIIHLLYRSFEELTADQIFLLLNQSQKSYSYACVYRNIRMLREQKLLIVTTKTKTRYPSRYQLTATLKLQLTH